MDGIRLKACTEASRIRMSWQGIKLLDPIPSSASKSPPVKTPYTVIADKLDILARSAEALQLHAGTTAPSLDHLDPTRRVTRDTISVVLLEGTGRNPRLIFHREPAPQKPEITTPPKRRLAVFGGGLEAEQERLARDAVKTDPLLVDPALLGPDGTYPPDYWYRRQGKELLERGQLLQMTYHHTPETITKILRQDLFKRLKMEAGAQALRGVSEPVMLGGTKPVVTHVLNRRLGDYTERIAAKHGMTVNERGELVGIGISVNEYFAMAQVDDAEAFVRASGGNAVMITGDELIARAEGDTKDLDAWKARLSREEPLPVRNSSLLVGSAGAVRELAFSWSKLWQNFWQRRGPRGKRMLATAA